MNPTTLTLHMSVDLAHGGRWTSLRGGSREWLWQREDPRRHQVRPGDAFVDAGGLAHARPPQPPSLSAENPAAASPPSNGH
ncbi:hypothetical protein OG905_08930 [Streptomyces sp. NBC_00322]|uniref:hypothetical protein n=1 Tax=Streptomyces sp. NBC_00322 TaxID=2975712 RepID=UPI002E295DCE|nr:hypothetical protein [Streptomyces sp. NBC_00322]